MSGVHLSTRRATEHDVVTPPPINVPTETDIEEAKTQTHGIYCPDLDRLAHDVIRASVECMKSDRHARERVFRRTLLAYTVVFIVGILAFAVAMIEGLMDRSNAATTSAFAGLSAVSFVSLFIFRPLDQLRKSSISLTWLNVVTTSYWTRHYYLNKTGSLDAELEKATTDTLLHLEELLQAGGKGTPKKGSSDEQSPSREEATTEVPPRREDQSAEVEEPGTFVPGRAAEPLPDGR